MVSIVIPIFNAEIFLRECLDSLLSQSYQDWEGILVDDGSTDSSGKIMEEYARGDSRFKVLNIANSGPSEARNKGILSCRGEYLMFVDADDALLPGAIDLLLSAMQRTGADIVEGRFIAGTRPPRTNTQKTGIKKTRIFAPDDAVADMLYQKHFTSAPWGKIFRRCLFDGLQFKQGIIYEDLDLMYKLFLRAGKVAYINNDVYFYRQSNSSLMHSWNESRLDVLEVTRDIEQYMIEHFSHLVPAARDRRLSAAFNMFVLASMHREPETATKCMSIIKKFRKASLLNRHVRLKNKIGIVLSFFGSGILVSAGRLVYRK